MMSEKFEFGAGRNKLTQCLYCRHRVEGVYPIACPAFPGASVPDAILSNAHDHHEPYPGDHGIQFEPFGSEPYRPISKVKS